MNNGIFETQRLVLFLSHKSLAQGVWDYYKRNREFLTPWETSRPEGFYTLKSIRRMLKAERKGMGNLRHLCFWIAKKDNPQKIIGAVTMSPIYFGNSSSCNIGYKLDKDEEERGYMTEAVKFAVSFAFNILGLHRVESCVIPTNSKSRRVLIKCGFEQIGFAREYLEINGKREDHEIYDINKTKWLSLNYREGEA
ncbi:MAG: GNAT family N-acetyltransferase [Clostridiales bacterium]|nr:GNAT family N-acetyltransferase [Clostridiales bacterium]